MTEKILTVIIPMYNAKPWIRRCLRSLLVQTRVRPYLEVLVIDDGSADGCDRIANQMAEEMPGVFRLIQKENGGHGSAVNCGVSQSSGKYIKVLDADDWMITSELEKLLDELCLLNDPDVVLCAYRTADMRTGKKETVRAAAAGGYVGMEELAAHWERYRAVCTFHGIIYRTAFYRQHCKKLPERVFYDDSYYAIVPASHAAQIYVSRRCLYVYRIGRREQSVSAENRVRRLSDAGRVITAVCATMQERRSSFGQKYWKLRTVSLAADYLVTCFLRSGNKRAGRGRARCFMKKLRTHNPVLARALRGRYWLLRCMGFLHIKEASFQKLLQVRKNLFG
ncbi:MAG: glycosyltransferase family 2 protein [Eubacterium sp.]|nr:glycosyltransferase family 2 protein [Eubacterium sp.]